MKTFTALFPFCGAGGGALGFRNAETHLFGHRARFEIIGGIDIDPEACADFEYLVGAPALCADIAKLTPVALRGFAGVRVPNVVFLSAPCKGSTKLISDEKAAQPEYQALNRLSLDWIELMLSTWDTPPDLVLFENVPNITTRARAMLAEVRRLLLAAGYLIHDGFHECGELGGLAQRRRRWLMVARLPSKVPPLLYQPPKRRVRACGEVLGPLPMPEDPAAGPLHRLPRISWLNWVRLALIPAGGDWRDLPKVLEDGQARREVFRRQHVEAWTDPSITVAGPGSNGPYGVADPRVRYHHCDRVTAWETPTGTVTTSPAPSSGAIAVADPRIIGMHADNPDRHYSKYAVECWDAPSPTVTGATRPGSGGLAVADPRAGQWFPGAVGIVPWEDATGTVTGRAGVTTGRFSVADPRVKRAFDHGYAVLPWTAPSFTVAGQSLPGCGAYSVADPRMQEAAERAGLGCSPQGGAYGVLPWEQAAKTVTGAACFDNGRFAVADPRVPGAPPIALVDDIEKPPFILVEEQGARGKVRPKRVAVPVVILAADGTWHRPLTTLELAVLQGLPSVVRGEPLRLAGNSVDRWRERIGNCVPALTAQAIAEQMLITLLSADVGGFALSSAGGVWVEPNLEGAVP